MKNKILLTALVMALMVIGGFYGLIRFTGTKTVIGAKTKEPAVSTPSDVKFVPALERIRQQIDKKTPRDIREHTRTEPPKVKIFQTLYKDGTQVTFNHEAHTATYGLGCIECHHVERCSRCHAMRAENDVRITTGKQALHENCIACHAELGGPEKCADCHKQ